jgi:uncharacterized hydrophobic protein (TIGR00271 family)
MQAPNGNDMKIIDRITIFVKHWLQKTAAGIGHEAVIKDIVQETDISTGYFLLLSAANLIALSGLITNSAPVIIGAMLISPLMGPILSFGFAFTTGAKQIWKRSVKKIIVSIVVTLVVAALASLLSPMKELTQEMISRTRPNLYDLIIAFLAGSAGAAALCTKKNYLTVVPGVAIATAVIPPLSVAGFGIGVWNYSLFFGGLFLFFTNFVAITIATGVVFFVFGFRPRMITGTDVSQLKKRMAYLGTILIIISIPLVYTLHVSISEVRLRSEMQRLLKQEFDREKTSHLTTFNYVKTRGGKIEINVVINAVEYLNDETVAKAEKVVADSLGENVKLNVEQVKVQPGGLKPQVVKPIVPAIAPPQAAVDVIKTSRDSVIAVVRQSSEKLEKIIAPSTIADFYVGFYDKTVRVSIAMKIRRDAPVTDEERIWLRRMLSAELNLPVDLTIETMPFVPPLVFKRGETTVSDDMKTAIRTVQDAYGKEPAILCRIEAFPENGIARAKQQELARKRIEGVEQYLVDVCKIPRDQIASTIHTKSSRTPTVKISVLALSKTPGNSNETFTPPSP